MIEVAIKTLEPIISGLPYVQHYGGLSFKAERYQEADGRKLKENFPVQSTLSQLECWNAGKYRNLVPNSNYTSLFYWEVRSEMVEFSEGRGNKIRSFKGVARLVYWLNLPKLGKTATELVNANGVYSMGALIQGNIIKALQAQRNIPVGDANFQGSSVLVPNARIINKDLNIFSQYSYGPQVQQLLYYPYDFGAIDFELHLRVPIKCLSDINIGTDLGCITNW